MLLQLEREHLQADLAQVQALLIQSPPDEDPIEHFQFVRRARELERRLAELPQAIESGPAAVALFFGGRPVVGSLGINANFSSSALGHFQKLISQRFAADLQGPLASRGRVPMAEDTQMLVTDLVRGSFGFVLQAAAMQPDVQASLKVAVDEVADTLARVAAADDSLFDAAAAVVDERQLGTLKDFFRLLDSEGASLRLVEGERDFELNGTAITRARQRVDGLSIEDREDDCSGQIVGWSEYAHRFELLPHSGGVLLSGAVDRELMRRVVQEGLNPLHQHVDAHLKVRETKARNRQIRRSHLLRTMTPALTPASWPAPGQQAFPVSEATGK